MQRRNFLRTTIFTTGGLLLAQKEMLAAFQQQRDFNITMLSKEAGVFTEKGGTILFLLGKEGIVTVDAEIPEQAQHLIDELKKKTDKPFKMLINTHHHADHTAGNIAFKGLTEHVLAHNNSAINQKNVAVNQKTEDKQLYPDKTFGNTWSITMDRPIPTAIAWYTLRMKTLYTWATWCLTAVTRLLTAPQVPALLIG